ncbi:MAG: WG repeat-containing protein [Blastocatellia bacterium]|nr:WG repeat-containing protein [Blastocatellia bacterium]
MKYILFCGFLLFSFTACKQIAPLASLPTKPTTVEPTAQPEEPEAEMEAAPSPEVEEPNLLDRLERVSPSEISAADLFRVKYNGKWGYVDRQGRVVIEPQFAEANDFSEGLACVSLESEGEGRFGFIDKTGHFVIQPRFSHMAVFQDGTTAIGDEIIDRTGKILKKIPGYVSDNNYSEGLVQFHGDNGKIGFLDKSGKVVIKPQFEGEVGDFSDGLAWVEVHDKIGYIDTIGKMVIPPRFEGQIEYDEDGIGSNFHEGYANVYLNVDKRLCAYIDKTGKVISHLCGGSFSGGLAPVTINHKPAFLDTTGNVLLRPSVDRLSEFSEGLAIALSPKGSIGFIDKNLKFVIPPQFAEAGIFSRGLAWARKDEQYGLIDKTGKFVVKPIFEAAGASHDKERF